MRTKAGFFSLTPVAPAAAVDEEREYLRWHLLDHMPEQYQLPGIVYGLRWIADEDCRTVRLAAQEPLDRLGHVVHYLFTDPVEQTIADFLDLGARLREVGRFPISRPSLRLSAVRLEQCHAAPQALISADVVPFRPHRGIMLLIEEPADARLPEYWLQWLHTDHYPKLLAQTGIAGAWTFGTPYAAHAGGPAWATDPHYVTVIYLDDDPVQTTRRLAPILAQRWTSGQMRPMFAGPLRSMIDWEAWY